MTTPASAILTNTGQLQVTWNANPGAGLTYPFFNNDVSLQYAFLNQTFVTPNQAGTSAGKLLNPSGTGVTTTFDAWITCPASETGSGAVLNIRNKLSALSFGITGNQLALNMSQTVSFTNNYTGPTTDLKIDPAGNKILAVVSGNTATITTKASFFTITGNNAQFYIRVNGVLRTTTGVTRSGANLVVTFNGAAILPSDTVEFAQEAGVLNYTLNGSGNIGLVNIQTDFTAVTNNAAYVSPTYVSSAITTNGTRFTVTFSQNVTAENFTGNLTIVGNISGTRTFSPLSIAGNTATYTLLTGQAVYNTEVLNNISYPTGAVRTSGAPAGQANNVGFTIPGFTVASGGATVPVVGLQTPTLGTNGRTLTLVFSAAVTYNAGTGTIVPLYSPIGTQSLGAPGSGNGTSTWTYTLNANQLRIGDTLKINLPAGFATGVSNGVATVATVNAGVINNSTIAWPKPVLSSAAVLADGQSAKLVFDRAVVIKQPTFNDSLKVLAQDKTAPATRLSSVLANTAALATTNVANDSVIFNFTGTGYIFGNNIGGPGAPNDGDNAKIHTGTVAGIVSSQLSETVGPAYTALNDAIGTPTNSTDFANSVAITNNSTVVEPAAPVVPEFSQAEIYDQVSPPEQFLRVRWKDGASLSVKVQPSVFVPTLSGSLTGATTLVYERTQTGLGDGDETIYRITGDKMKRASDGEDVTLGLPASTVVSNTTGSPNVLQGPYLDSATANFVNNSTVPQPQPSQFAPVVQQIQIGGDGFAVGIYYDIEVDALVGNPSIEGTLSGTRSASFITSTPTQLTLASFNLSGIVPIFRGETVIATLPAGLVANNVNDTPSLEASNVPVENNSLIPVPLPPVVDSVTLNDPGTLLTITFNVPVVESDGIGHVIASKSGYHGLKVVSINGTVLTAAVAGIVFETETLELFLQEAFVKESRYNFTSNEPLNNFVVDVSGRTGAAPDLPSNAIGLKPEAV